MWSSVEELARYELALQHGVFLEPASVKDSRTVKTFPNWSGAEPPSVGWSWFIRALPDPFADHVQEIGHTGSQGGFTANYATFPDKDVIFVFLMNGPHDRDAVTKTIIDELITASRLD